MFGHSLGSTVAVDLASRVPAAGLILEGALTSVIERGAGALSLYPGAHGSARSRFSSIDKISRVRIPKLFLHARADDVVPLAHGRRLFEAAPPPKTFVELKGGHGDAFRDRFRHLLQQYSAVRRGLPEQGETNQEVR